MDSPPLCFFRLSSGPVAAHLFAAPKRQPSTPLSSASTLTHAPASRHPPSFLNHHPFLRLTASENADAIPFRSYAAPTSARLSIGRGLRCPLPSSFPVVCHCARTRPKSSAMDDRAVPEWDPSPDTTTSDSRAVPESSTVAVPALFFSPPLPHYFFSPTRPVESCVVSSSSWTPDVAAPKRKRGRDEGDPTPVMRKRRVTDGRVNKEPVEAVSKRTP